MLVKFPDELNKISTKHFWAYEYEPLADGNSIDISSTLIDEGRFSAHWVGNSLDANAANTATPFAGSRERYSASSTDRRRKKSAVC